MWVQVVLLLISLAIDASFVDSRTVAGNAIGLEKDLRNLLEILEKRENGGDSKRNHPGKLGGKDTDVKALTPYNNEPILVYVRPIMCDFDEDIADCHLSNNRGDRTEFVRTASCLGTTSPCRDHTTGSGYYLVFRSAPTLANDKGQLNGPWLLFQTADACVGGFFAVGGVASLKLVVQSLSYELGDVEYPITLSGNWKEVNVTIHVSGPFRIVYVVQTHDDVSATVSLDDIYVKSDKCKTSLPPTTTTTSTLSPTSLTIKPTAAPTRSPTPVCQEYEVTYDAHFFGARKVPGTTVEDCKAECNSRPCSDGGCMGFDYDRSHKGCWLLSSMSGVNGRRNTDVDHYTRKTGSTVTNLALNKPTAQSDTYPDGESFRAVDGSRNQDYNAIYGCTHTENNVTDTTSYNWWVVDLEVMVANISSVVVYSRALCCSGRLGDFTIVVTNRRPWKGERISFSPDEICARRVGFPAVGGIESYSCKKQGRFVAIVQARSQILSLCEVEVYGTVIKVTK